MTMSRALWWSWGGLALSYERGTPVLRRVLQTSPHPLLAVFSFKTETPCPLLTLLIGMTGRVLLFLHKKIRSGANIAHVRQSRPDFGLGFRINVL